MKSGPIGRPNGLIAMLLMHWRGPTQNGPNEPKNSAASNGRQECNVMRLKLSRKSGLMLMGLLLTLSGCAANSPSCKPDSVEPAKVPALPSAARQQPAPQWCYPTCTEAVRADSQNSAARLTELE